MLCTRTERCDSREITCFTPMVREICSSKNQEITSRNRWNGWLSQGLRSLRSPTSIRPLVRKGALPGAVQKKIQTEAKQHEGIFLGIKDESEVAVMGTLPGKVFARSIRRVPKEDSGDGILFNRIRGLPCVRHEYECCDVCVNRSDDNMLDDCFQVSQRLTSDPTTTPQQCHKEIGNAANRADQRSAKHVRSWLQEYKIPSLERKMEHNTQYR